MPKFQYIKHAHSVSLLLAHFVITTNRRKPTLKEEYDLPFFQQAIQKHDSKIKIAQMELGEDFAHAHFLIQYSNTVSMSYVAQIIKGCSSKEIKGVNPDWKGWSRGFFVSSTGGSAVEAIEKYIATQRD
jgi:putative transposase